MDLKHDEMAKALEATGDYRVLRRRPPFQPLPVAGETTTLAMVIDVETTGLDTDRAEIIELGIVPFRYTAERIVEVLPAFSRFNEPAAPITEEISRITGITKEMVSGHRIDPREVAEVVDPCSFVIAHNAGFDRRVAERHFPALAAKPWACSVEEIGWKEAGFASARLGAIAGAFGFFFDAHRATDDCLALIEILSRPMPGDAEGRTVFSLLRAAARRPTTRLLAASTPFDAKDLLKARGYRWEAGQGGRPKGWFRDLTDDVTEEETGWLAEAVYTGRPDVHRYALDAWSRYSEREWA